MFCPFCGAQIRDGMKFCPVCGNALGAFAGSPSSDEAQQPVHNSPSTEETVILAGPAREARHAGKGKVLTMKPPKKQKNRLLPAVLIALSVLVFAMVLLLLFLPKKPKGGGDTPSASSSASVVIEGAQNGSGNNAASQESGKPSDLSSAQGEGAPAPGDTAMSGATEEASGSPSSEEPAPSGTESSEPAPTEAPAVPDGPPVATHTDNAPSLAGLHQVSIVSAEATSSLDQGPDYDNTAKAAFDGDIITSWQDGADGDGTGEVLKVRFSGEEQVSVIVLRLGNWRNLTNFTNNNRPKELTLTLGTESFRLAFEEAMVTHYVVFDRPVSASSLTVRVESVYLSQFNDCCISEITLYAK